MTFEKLLRMQIKGYSPVEGKSIEFSPDFRVSVQNLDAEFSGKKGVHIIVHADEHNSETLDLLVCGNKSYKLAKKRNKV